MASSVGGEFDLSDPVNSFVWAVKSLVTAPAAFFRRIPRNASIKNPPAFVVVCSPIAAVPAAVVILLFGLSAGASGDVVSALGGVFGAILDVLAHPVATVVGLFIGTGIFHLLVLLFIGQSNDVAALAPCNSAVAVVPVRG